MEFAAITETLLIDADGVYDPGDVNDRMLLGMKSTIGEVELHVMAQRLQASKRAAAERGELRTPLPVGYVHDEAGEIVIDPDAEVQAAIGDLFAAFTACGSAYGVVAAFADRRFPLRAYGGAWAGQLRWGALTHARVLGVLRNPCYAGAYVHGRYSSRRRVDPDGTVHTGLVERSRAEWPVLIHDHHDGYIGWADYLANEAALAANRTNAGARPPREGSALCQGIMICGSCGKPMRTNYHTDQRPAYECSGRADRLTTPTCRSIAASTVDEAVTELLLNALNPNEIALALAAADEVADRHRRIGRAAELAVERARYEADRAERAFHAVEPDNRLVARSLETRWEAKLAALAQAEQALAAARDTLPPLPERAELEKLAADLPGLWHAPTTSNKDRKRLLRTVIADITLLPEPDQHKARIGIRWHTGASDELRVDRAVHPGTAVRSPSPAVDMVTLRGSNSAAVIARLNPIIKGWAAYYRGVVSSKVFHTLDYQMWKLTYKWATWQHNNKPKRWIVEHYFGKRNKFRNDRWVFGDPASDAYLVKFSWTDIVRHVMVHGAASPDDPALADYWAERRRKVKPPLDNYTLRLLARQDARCPLCGDHLLTADQPPQSPNDWERWWQQVTRQAIAADYLVHHGRSGPPHNDQTRLVHASCRRGLRARRRQEPAQSTCTPSRLA